MNIIRKMISFIRTKYVLLTAFNSFGAVILMWSPNKESDLMGYKIYYGTASRKYDTVIDVGNITEYKVENLEVGKRYYFAATAYDTAGNESQFSEEVSGVIQSQEDPPSEDETNAETLSLAYNYPNPFRIEKEVTHLRYFLAESCPVAIKIYDVDANLIKTLFEDTFKSAGEHVEDFWDGKNENGDHVSNGIFLCKIMTKERFCIIKIAVVR